MVEMLITISVIGILSSVAIVQYKGVVQRSEVALAGDFVEQLNNALKEFEQGAWELSVVADDSSTAEEEKVLRTLQHKAIDLFGSPYFRQDWNPSTTDDNSVPRVRWNGLNFELIAPGVDGKGYLIDSEGLEYNTSYTVPNGVPILPSS